MNSIRLRFLTLSVIVGSIRRVGSKSSTDTDELADIDHQRRLGRHIFYATIKNLLDDYILYSELPHFSISHLVPGHDGRRIELSLTH